MMKLISTWRFPLETRNYNKSFNFPEERKECAPALFKYHLNVLLFAPSPEIAARLPWKFQTAEFIFPRKVVQGICTASIDYARMQGTYNGVSAPNLFDRSHGISTRQSRWSWIMERTRTIATENFNNSLAGIFGMFILYFIYYIFFYRHYVRNTSLK